MLRVLHVLDHSIPLHSGYTFRTRAILREQGRLGWETFHLTTPKHTAISEDEEIVDGLHFYRTRAPKGFLAGLPVLGELAQMRATARRLDEVVRLVKPDVIHAHSPVLNALPALKIGKRHGIPVLYEVRAFWEDAAADHGTAREGGLRYRATRALETYALKKANHVTTICEGLRADIVARGKPTNEVTVIPNAVDVELFTFTAPQDPALKKELGLEGATVIGFIGSYYAYEGIDLLLDAVQILRTRHPRFKVLLVGGGPQEKALHAQVERLGLNDCVKFVGRVPNAEVQRYYNLVDLLVYARHPMRLTELVTPLKPLEAMAQGKLFVASDVGGHRELVKDRVTGYLFRAGDVKSLSNTIEELLAAHERWPELRAAGRKYVENERTWQRSVANYREVFSGLVGRAV